MTYKILDEDVVAVSPSTTYRILRNYRLTTRWNNNTLRPNRKGFIQPTRPHEHWHIDISYITFYGSHLFQISVLDDFPDKSCTMNEERTCRSMMLKWCCNVLWKNIQMKDRNECTRVQSLIDMEDAREKVAEYIQEYNNKRLYSGIGFITPLDMISGNADSIFKERDLKLEQARKRRRENNKLKKAA